MPNSNHTRPAACLPHEIEDVQPNRHIKSVNTEQWRSKKLAPKPTGEAHSSTGHNVEKKERSTSKSQPERRLSSTSEQEEQSYSNKSESDESTEDSRIDLVKRPQSTKSDAPPRACVEEHIDVMREGQVNLHERMAQPEKKVKFYKNLSEESETCL
ncbi:unnamed protein product [Rhizoctonia solani]|nr:unnamed protein product [Rhizoctonia solani]